MSDNSKKRMDPVITAAIIGVIGTIAVALITVFGNRQTPPPATEPPQVVNTIPFTFTAAPTDTAGPGEPTSTPAPTNTPEPTFTATAIPPVALGQDWAQGCISSLWKPYSSKGPLEAIEKDGCLSQPVNVFFANNGKLSFIYEARLSSAEVNGLFAPLPNSEGSVSLTVSLRDLNTSDIWIGVFADSSIDSQGLLMTIPAGTVSERPLVVWQMPGLEKVSTTKFLNQGMGYSLKFEYAAGSVRATILPNVFVTNTYPIPSAQKWLFIGYQASNGTNRIDATFFDLVIGN